MNEFSFCSFCSERTRVNLSRRAAVRVVCSFPQRQIPLYQLIVLQRNKLQNMFKRVKLQNVSVCDHIVALLLFQNPVFFTVMSSTVLLELYYTQTLIFPIFLAQLIWH